VERAPSQTDPTVRKKKIKYVARKAIMCRTSYITCKAQCKLKIWGSWWKKKKTLRISK
jgi:hypothetical protein